MKTIEREKLEELTKYCKNQDEIMRYVAKTKVKLKS